MQFHICTDGVVLDRSVRSQERTIVPPGTRPALVIIVICEVIVVHINVVVVIFVDDAVDV